MKIEMIKENRKVVEYLNFLDSEPYKLLQKGVKISKLKKKALQLRACPKFCV